MASLVALVAGISLLALTFGAGNFVAAVLATGVLGGSATIVAAPGASGGLAVRFGSSPTPSPSPTPTHTPSPTPQPTPTPGITFNTCTSPTNTIPMDPNNAQAGVTLGNYYLSADTWNASAYQLTQTVYACDYNNWYVIANENNNNGDGAVKTSPNIHQDFSEPKIANYSAITSIFADTPPSPEVGIWEFEYDIWLNGVASNGSTEIMIWTYNHGQTPSGSIVASFADGGQTYDVWKSGSYIAFVDRTNVQSGNLNLLDFFNFVISKGWIPTSSTIGQIDHGMELVSTNGTNAKFQVNNFSITAQ